jgi:hypothetical protein
VGRRPTGRALRLIKCMVPSRTLCAGDSLGEASTFAVGGLDIVGSVGARAELFVFKGSAGGWIDDGVGAARKRFELRGEVRGAERGGDAGCGLAARMRKGVVLGHSLSRGE